MERIGMAPSTNNFAAFRIIACRPLAYNLQVANQIVFATITAHQLRIARFKCACTYVIEKLF